MPKKSKRLIPTGKHFDSECNDTAGSASHSSCLSPLGSCNLEPKPEQAMRDLQQELAVVKEMLAQLCRSNDNPVASFPVADRQPESEVSKAPKRIVKDSASLPKVELSSFDGNPVDYWKFIRQFECHVESKTTDSGQLLLYLTYYCRGKARNAIDACVMLPPEEGYERARSILKEMFGLPHVVARSLLNEMLSEATRVRNTSDSLSNLALRMENCQIALKQMGCEADLNSVTTLEGVVKCLPVALQHQWADAADELSMDGHGVTFEHLTQFVSRRARIARSRFGQLLETTSSNTHQQSPRAYPNARSGFQTTEKRNVFVTTSDVRPSMKCCICQASHELQSCPKFIESDVKSRWEIARRNAVCFLCLRPAHGAVSCKYKPWCTAENCGKRHHILLHYNHAAEKPSTNIHCSHAAFSAKVFLGSVPIKIETPNGLINAVALLDSGSDATLILNDFVEQNRMPKSPAQVSLTTLGHQRKLTCSRLKFEIHSFDGSQVIHVPEAYTVEKLPRVSQCPMTALSERPAYLKDVDFLDVSDQPVTVLIGCDVPEAHWALEQRLGGRRRPFATKTLLGWILQGPACQTPKDILCLNSSLEQGSIDECVNRLYNAEIADIHAEGNERSRDDEDALSLVSGSKIIDGHFQVPLPWKPDRSKLTTNYLSAERRLSYLRRRFERDSVLFERYSKVMAHHLEIGYIEPVLNNATENIVWYLPHHPVFNPKKPEKLRVVFDCAAKHNGVLLNDVHLLEGHSGLAHTLSVLRRTCTRLDARSASQLMADLPPVRVATGSYPFAKVGLDYFGPFEVKRGRSVEKRYGCLFTCWQSRAVHIEVANSMDTDPFLMTLFRFIGRRGKPQVIYSDNGSNFVGAERVLRIWLKGLESDGLSERLASHSIKWCFNPPYSSHRGGVWERLIRSIRRALNVTCAQQTPSDETLQTALIEVERILNNRPLVPFSSDDIDSLSLCPNDLLLNRSNDGMRSEDGFVDSYKRNWKQSLHLANVFWKRWKSEYLPLLQTRQKWIHRKRNFRVGDIVLVNNVEAPKRAWPLGIVVNIHVSEDNLVRSVVVRTKNGLVTRDTENLSAGRISRRRRPGGGCGGANRASPYFLKGQEQSWRTW